MQRGEGENKSSGSFSKWGLLAGAALVFMIMGIGVVTYPSSSLAAEQAQWTDDAKENGWTETRSPPGPLGYIYAGVEYLGNLAS
jgi:hypothetical protein